MEEGGMEEGGMEEGGMDRRKEGGDRNDHGYGLTFFTCRKTAEVTSVSNQRTWVSGVMTVGSLHREACPS